jgi:hypothetical protein
MEKMRDPAVLIGAGNGVCTLLLGFYFHKQIEKLKTDMAELRSVVDALSKRNETADKTDKKRTQLLSALSDKIKSMGKRIDAMDEPSLTKPVRSPAHTDNSDRSDRRSIKPTPAVEVQETDSEEEIVNEVRSRVLT